MDFAGILPPYLPIAIDGSSTSDIKIVYAFKQDPMPVILSFPNWSVWWSLYCSLDLYKFSRRNKLVKVKFHGVWHQWKLRSLMNMICLGVTHHHWNIRIARPTEGGWLKEVVLVRGHHQNSWRQWGAHFRPSIKKCLRERRKRKELSYKILFTIKYVAT